MNNFKDDVNDLLEITNDVFGEPVKYYPTSGGFYEIKAVFDQNYESIDPDTEQVISGNQPVLGVNLNNLPFEIRQGDLVRVHDGTEFRVIDSREDGQGGANLFLQRTNDDKKTNKRAYSRFS